MARRLILPLVAVVSVTALTATSWVASASAAVNTRTANVASDAAWIRSGQLADGAIAWYVDRQHISPYQANYAAIGLAEARKVTGTNADLTAAVSWLKWYQGHEDASGFVTDYNVDASGVETSTGDMDSTDAYAGTYLLAVLAAYRAGATRATLKTLKPGIAGAVAAIEATRDTDGLTWAKPTWHVKYLMDQSETYAGLRAASTLAGVLGNSALKTQTSADAAAMAAGVATEWNSTTGSYDWARHDGGAQNSTDWSQLYPDTMEQAWAATFGLADPSRSTALMATAVADHPQWDQPAATDDVDGSIGTVGYWPVAGWALLRTGQTASAAAAATSIRAGATTGGRPWPVTTGVEGQLIVLEAGDLSLLS
jgi:hypothetical protein